MLATLLAITLAGVASADPANTQQPVPPASTAPASAATEMTPVVVHGAQPGPGLWKVRKGTHVMWVIALSEPLPAHMEWSTQAVEIRLNHSQQVLDPPGLAVGGHVGFFGSLALLPAMIGLRNIPDGKHLADVLSPDLYQRWTRTRAANDVGTFSTERLRPMFAAQVAYEAALKRAGMTNDGGTQATIDRLAKAKKIPRVDTNYVAMIADPHKAIKTFKASAMDDTACMVRQFDAIDSGLTQAKARANAWAIGDIPALRAQVNIDMQNPCLDALSTMSAATQIGITDLQQHIETTWMTAAQKALENNEQTFAMLPIKQVLAPGGYLARLKATGYVVVPPGDDDADAPSTAAAP